MRRLISKFKHQTDLNEDEKVSRDVPAGFSRLSQVDGELSDSQLANLVSAVKDWQLCNGSVLKLMQEEQFYSSFAYPVGVTLFPSPFPEDMFLLACHLQTIFNELYVAVSQDDRWLYTVLQDLIDADPLTRTLWDIHEKAKAQRPQHSVGMGIFRSDYMLHELSDRSVHLKQVEFNTISCAGAVHGNRVTDMHRFFQATGLYNSVPSKYAHSCLEIPPNDNKTSLCTALAEAHHRYGKSRSALAHNTCVLFVVQPDNFNVTDERPLEYQLWSLDPPVQAYRLEWGKNLTDHTTLTEDDCLLYQPPQFSDPVEVAVVYYRAGFEEAEYEDCSVGKEAKLRFEVSRAIKCPPILAHLATYKKVQQALCLPGGVERFLSAEKAALIKDTFAVMFALDDSESGVEGRKRANSLEAANKHVLKPSREGGGHNVYRDDIPQFLASIPKSKWKEYVLMEMIQPPASHNMLMNMRGIYQGSTVCELGIIGSCSWDISDDPSKQGRLLNNSQIGWSVRTKNATVDEMSVVKGYGCFDSIVLTTIQA